MCCSTVESCCTSHRAVRVDYNPPFDNLLARLIPARVHRDIQQHEREQPKTRRETPAASDV